MSKVGWFTKDEGKFFGKIIAGEFPVKGIIGTALKWMLPMALNTADDKWADKVPEPWQTYIETLITMLYNSCQDNVITPAERKEIRSYCVTVMNSSIDIPWIEENDEAIAFLKGWEFIASLLYKWAGKDEGEDILL